MWTARVPRVYADGRWRSADETDAIARRWHAAILDAIGDRHRVVAAALPASPDGVALFVALTALPWPLVLLSPDAAEWPPVALPPRTPVVLLPALAHLRSAAERVGACPIVLPHAEVKAGDPAVAPFSGAGLVMFSSGSTGAPKPIFRSMSRLLAAAATRAEALGLRRGEGILLGVTLVHGQGMNMLITAMQLGGPVGFVPPVNYWAALDALAKPEFGCWRATPHYTDLLGRCELRGPAVAPRVCLLSSPISRGVFDRFRERFGVPVREAYSSGETGPVAVDSRPDAQVSPDTVGPLLAGVEVRIGASPYATVPLGQTGRVWVRSPFLMVGYGFPPDLERPGIVDGWWPTRDLAMMRDDGCLVLAGRIDDCIRTRDGRLVNLAAVADLLREGEHVRGVVVVPLDGPTGPSFGAVLECDAAIARSQVQAYLTDHLPPWARPRRLAIVASLPRLSSGKPDRRTCVEMFGSLEGTPS